MSCRTVVVDGHHRVGFFFAEGTYHVVGTFLHFGVGTLHGVQLDTATVASGIYRGYGTTAQADAVVVTTDDDYFVSGFRRAFQAVTFRAVAYAAGKHDYFVVAVNFFSFLMFKGQHGTAD